MFRPAMQVPKDASPEMAGNLENLSKFIKALDLAGQKLSFFYREPSTDDTSGPTTTSTSYVDLPPLKLNFTTTGGFLCVFCSATLSDDTSGQSVYMILAVNGSVIANTERVATNTGGYLNAMSTFWMNALGAGIYEVKAQWKVDANTATARTRNRAIGVLLVENA